MFMSIFKEERNVLSECVKPVRSLILCRIQKRKNCKNVRPRYAFQYIKANESLLPFYDKYAVVPADTASNNIVLVCKKYNHGCLINEMCISMNFAFANPTYKIQDLTRKKLWQSKQLKSTLS